MPSAVLERFCATVTSMALEVVLTMVLAGMTLEAADDNAGAIADGAVLINAAGAVVVVGAALIVLSGQHRSWLEFCL